MESPSRTLTLLPPPHSPSSSTTYRRRRSSSDSANSPEFEFSNIGCDPQTTLLSADELFSDGFLLPLHHLHPHRLPEVEPDIAQNEPETGPSEPSALITSSSSSNSILSASKRWREIFKRADKKPEINSEDKPEKLEKRREKEKKNGFSGHGNSSAELNINIWPFSRSRSAGNNSGRSRPVAQSNRKVSSAPCSRSNSSGESKSRKSWPVSSPGRAGVHLGRTSPVWQVRKTGSVNRAPNGGSSSKGRVLKLNVPVCIPYRQNLSCRSDESGGDGGGNGLVSGGGGGSGGNLFSLRGLFSKKSTVLTV
ncbi:hypothetical protein SOVF_003550 [Spinacia oleracea]|uniref:Uncharacterized protein n=1 Tax=Spinacia oleracea TaxID=3562 RepID=A0A9R0HVL9_SPIOL|nr:uncharacterized protein LOC110777552 [Spinacia oleracea]KNA25805.1 hypothetical protein SOVF_003550 [Spinacia oleracea]